jgi:hypothetical protein
MKEALEHLADLVKHGDDALVKNNADDALPIWVAIDNIDDDLDNPMDLCVNANGIYTRNEDGYLDPIPVYKVMG